LDGGFLKGVPVVELTRITFPFYLNTDCLSRNNLVANQQSITTVSRMLTHNPLAYIVYAFGTIASRKVLCHTFFMQWVLPLIHF
jgi:hypothetical protein